MKKRIYILLCIMMLNLAFAGNVFATDTSVSSYTLHQGWAPDYGWRAFNVSTSYIGNQYEQNGYQYVDGHDHIVWIKDAYGPEVPRGSATCASLELINSSGTTVGPILKNSNFSNGLHRSYYFDPTARYLVTQVSYSWLQGLAGTYRAKMGTMYLNPLFTGMTGTDYYYTPYF